MVFWRELLRGAVLAILLVVAGCSTTPPAQPPAPAPIVKPPAPTVVKPAPVPQPPPARPAGPSASAAWQPLLAKADAATQHGDYEQALALLERAQRIDPASGEVYLSMARTQLAKGDAAKARATAERGLLYCATDALCDALRALTH
jgi:Flp pilus assembly protein TadD